MNFEDLNIYESLLKSTDNEKNNVDFGIIGFDKDMLIKEYNEIEEKYSGYSKDKVLNKNIFIDIAPCMNNYLVALKFEQNDQLDEIIPYILSFKVKPVNVDLRLLKDKKFDLYYILIKRK